MMPIYEQECSEHGIFELLESPNLDRIKPCPICGKDSPRIISAVHFTFSNVKNGKWIGDTAKELAKIKKKRP